MNSTQAKNISLYSLLQHIGQSPVDVRKSGDEVWYCSPFRNEKTPSFKIKISDNVWYDFGEGAGGNIIDFVMRYKSYDFRNALNYLDTTGLINKTSNHKIEVTNRPDSRTLFDMDKPGKGVVIETKPIFSYALKNYVKERGLSEQVAYKYLKEVIYEVDRKKYFALGFLNRSGGWELRSSVFKGCIGDKDITLYERGLKQHIAVFEGFMDFLSCLTLYGEENLSGNVLVLNSVSLRGRGLSYIKTEGYKEVYTYFDNDKAGEETLEKFRLELEGVNVVACNGLYEGYRDFNDYLVRGSK